MPVPLVSLLTDTLVICRALPDSKINYTPQQHIWSLDEYSSLDSYVSVICSRIEALAKQKLGCEYARVFSKFSVEEIIQQGGPKVLLRDFQPWIRVYDVGARVCLHRDGVVRGFDDSIYSFVGVIASCGEWLEIARQFVGGYDRLIMKTGQYVFFKSSRLHRSQPAQDVRSILSVQLWVR
jgi:hypothetical protein